MSDMNASLHSSNFSSPEIQKAFQNVGILTFEYFPLERRMVATQAFADFFHTPILFEKMPFSVADLLIHNDDQQMLYEMSDEIDSGKTSVSANLRTKDGVLSRISVTATSFDEQGRISSTIGIVQFMQNDVRSGKTVEALSSDYSSVYYVDLEKDKVYPQRLSEQIEKRFGEALRKHPPYEKIIAAYINSEVLQEEREDMMRICSVANIEKILQDKNIYLHDYRIVREGEIRYCRMKIVNLSDKGDFKFFSFGFSDMTEHKTVELEQYAFRDPITGGSNYNNFKKKVRQLNMSGHFVSLDVKNFKIVNTVCGVKNGDRMLREISNLCDSFCDSKSAYGHINADHFVFYFAEKTEKDIIKITQLLTLSLLELSRENDVPKLIPYFGISTWHSGKDIEQTFSETTVAKHKAKDLQDRNFVFYSEDEENKILFNKQLEDDFANAIDHEDFEVWYQPKINSKTEKLDGAEALIRWKQKDGTYLQPHVFIPLFESDGLIKTLDEYVFTKVCRMQKERLSQGLKIVPISINLSRASIYLGDVVRRYKRIAELIDISPEFVPIEITESAAVTDSDVLDIMEKFTQAGFKIFMDDFGTGYSSLSTLNKFQFNTLKIDKSLIDYIGDYKGDKLLEYTIGLSKELGMSITAEGVESQSQVEFLKNHDCDNIQGYYYSKPLPLEEFEKFYDR